MLRLVVYGFAVTVIVNEQVPVPRPLTVVLADTVQMRRDVELTTTRTLAPLVLGRPALRAMVETDTDLPLVTDVEVFLVTGPGFTDAETTHVPAFKPTTFDPDILQIVVLEEPTFAVAVVPFGAVFPAVTSAETSDNDFPFATAGVPIFTGVYEALAEVVAVLCPTVVLVRFVIAPDAVTVFKSIDGCE
jgi:hypothetical protein